MARLQILALPAGPDDGRPPFMFVLDQISGDESDQIIEAQDDFNGVAKAAGACAVVAFHGMTIDLPANDTTAYRAPSSKEPETFDPELAALVLDTLGIEMTPGGVSCDEVLYRACRELQKSEATRRHLNRERDGLKARLQQVQEGPTTPDVMNAQQERPDVWVHGYKCGVLAARSAARPRSEETRKP